jgi:hypothetical protein
MFIEMKIRRFDRTVNPALTRLKWRARRASFGSRSSLRVVMDLR